MTQTPLPVILARLAWYGYSGKGALTAIAWAAGNDNGVGVEELAASDCTAGAVRFFARVFFCTGIAGVTGSSGGCVVCPVAGAGFRVDALAAIFKLGSAFFFFDFGVGIDSRVSNWSGRFAEVASCARAKGALASTTRTENGDSSSVDAHEKISYPCLERQIPRLSELVVELCCEKGRVSFVDCDRHYDLDHLCASRDRHRFEQVCEMENARQTGARTGSHGSGAPGKIAQSDATRHRHGSAPRINAAVPHELISLSFRSFAF